MTIDKLFRDINSRLMIHSEQNELYYAGDVLRAINDAVRELIVDAVNNRTAERLLVSEVVTPDLDLRHPHLLSATLDKPVLSTPDIRMSVYNAYYTTVNFDVATETAANAGQKGYIDGYPNIVLCLNNYTGGVQNEIIAGNVRNFAPNDGGFYRKDTAIQYQNRYWRVLQDFDSDGIIPSSETALLYEGNSLSFEDQLLTFDSPEDVVFKELFWVDTGVPYSSRPMIQPYHRIQAAMLTSPPQYACTSTIAFQYDTVYTTPDVKLLMVEYVPEWEDVTTPDSQLELPAEWEGEIKRRAIESLRTKGIANANS
jgi:hypothetical protein